MIRKLRRMKQISTVLFLAMTLSMMGAVVQASLSVANIEEKPFSRDDVAALLDTQTAHVLLDDNAKRIFIRLHGEAAPLHKELAYCCEHVTRKRGDLIEHSVFLTALAQVAHIAGTPHKSLRLSECDYLLREASAVVSGLERIVVDVDSLLQLKSVGHKELWVCNELTKIFTNRIDPIQPDGTPDTTATATISGFLHCDRSVTIVGTASVDRICPFTDGAPVVICSDLILL